MPLFCCTSVSSRLCTLNFYIFKITSSLSHLCLQELTCLVEEQDCQLFATFRAVACSDFEIIDLKQQFCGNTQTNTHTHRQTKYCNPPPTRQGLIISIIATSIMNSTEVQNPRCLHTIQAGLQSLT